MDSTQQIDKISSEIQGLTTQVALTNQVIQELGKTTAKIADAQQENIKLHASFDQRINGVMGNIEQTHKNVSNLTGLVRENTRSIGDLRTEIALNKSSINAKWQIIVGSGGLSVTLVVGTYAALKVMGLIV